MWQQKTVVYGTQMYTSASQLQRWGPPHTQKQDSYNSFIHIQFCGDEPVCGPWIRNISGISTQTHSKCGALGTYSEEIKLYVPGINTIIYHMIVGNLQIVLGTYTIVEFHCK